MTSLSYYLISLGAVLLVSAASSALVVWRLRHGLRQARAATLLQALGRYTDWVEAQGRAVRFQGPTQQSDPALQEIGARQRQWFPELGRETDALFAVHVRLTELLRAHEQLRAGDPEASLESGHDAAFMALWRRHCRIVQAMEQRLLAQAGAPASPPYQLPG